MAKQPTIYSLAADLGLHASTVSRAFSRPEMVRDEVRRRVLTRAAEVGYVPNAMARSLITGQKGLIGLLIPDIENPFFAPLVRAIQRAVAQEGVQILLMDTGLDPQAEADLVTKVRGQVDALIMASPRRPVKDLVAAAGGLPHVLVNRRNPGSASVVIDNSSALREVGDYLIGLGHKRIALLRGPQRSWAAKQRARAAREWASGAPVELVELGPYEALFEGGEAAAAVVKDAGVTAVIAFDDVMACGVVAGLTALGVKVPDEVSVVGCDDVLLARTLTPALTTISAPLEQVGEAVLDALRDGLSQAPRRQHVNCDGVLVLRESTARAAI